MKISVESDRIFRSGIKTISGGLKIFLGRPSFSKKKGFIAIFCLLLLYLFIGMFFAVLPTSVFSEASDLNHEQRDPIVIKASESQSRGFANTNEGLIQAIRSYKQFWNLAVSDNDSGYFEDKIPTENQSVAEITAEEFELICQIIAFEAGNSYDSLLAVATCVINRIAEGGFITEWEDLKRLKDQNACDQDPLAVLTSDGQFEAYTEGFYKRIEGKVLEEAKGAVIDCFVMGKRSHPFTCFRSYETEGSVKIGGNYYFAPTEKNNLEFVYTVRFKREDQFVNSDPDGDGNWDLLYLICAYDASKDNLEGKIEETSRFHDLLYGVGSFIIKATFGTTIEVEKEVMREAVYPTFEPVELMILEGDSIRSRQFYQKSGEKYADSPVKEPLYQNLTVVTIPEIPEGIEVLVESVDPEKGSVLTNQGIFTLEKRDDLYLKTDQEVSYEPYTEVVTETKRVAGLKKAVLLDILGLEAHKPYQVLGEEMKITNSDYIEYSREALIQVLSLEPEEFSFFASPTLGNLVGGSPIGWVWPLDPLGSGAFLITSLMGERDSPGGIGSTDHGGTDIGASAGVAVLAVEDGIVEIAYPFGGYGNCIKLYHGTLKDGYSYQTLYGHLSQVFVSPGERVKKGDVIGTVGSTGWSTGPHLHFEVIQNGLKINGLSMYDQSVYDRLTFDL